jgi:hypothetical protein
MATTNVSDQILWKQLFHEAALELEPEAFQKRLEAARNAIESRLMEVGADYSSNACELVELKYAQYAVSVLRRTRG